MAFKVTLENVEDGTLGLCIACGEMAYGVEPDACGYECEDCGKCKVYGLEELVMMGMIELVDEEEIDEEEIDDE